MAIRKYSAKLPLEHVFQKEDDYNCGPSCLEMIYRLRGIKRTVKDILKDFHFEKLGSTTYPAQLARDLIKNGLKTKIIISNPRAISPAWVNLPKEKIIDNLKDWLTLQSKHDWHTFGLHLLFYLQEGGEVELKSYTVVDIKKMLDKGSLLGIALDEAWLYGHRLKVKKAETDEFNGDTYGHFIVVTGYKGNKFSILDPYPTVFKEKHGSYAIDAYQLLNASLIWAGTIIEVLRDIPQTS